MAGPQIRSEPSGRVVVGIDTGGTFTDVTLIEVATGRIFNAKTPSTPDDPSSGFAEGIASVLQIAGRSGRDIERVLHGTTVATNLILENKGAPAALLTTTGFRYVLEIGRQDVPRRASLFSWVKPKRPVPASRIYEIGGRIGPDGAEHQTLDETAVREAVRLIRASGIAAIAVVFLHSYANPAHERRAAEIIAEEHPQALVSLSSDVLAVFREYERSMTTILNVHVMPVVSAYVARLGSRLEALGISAPLLLMKSSGGVTGADAVKRAPVETALSGPAAGAVGAAFAGQSAGIGDIIGIDIGGTSADVSLIRGGEPGLTTNGRIGDWPIGLPIVDIITIGAGGGSIARVNANGRLEVGPQSAGAVPGPVCYGRGGTEPTVTDAHLVLGHLPPALLGGRFKLDADAARRAIRERIAEPLGLGVEAAARGILAIVDNHMVGAIRVVSVERGHDPRGLTLLPFGGAGPLHGGALARLLGMPRILVPPAPGVLSALGLLASSLKADFSRTALQRAGEIDAAQVSRIFAELELQASAWLDAEAVPPEARRLSRWASVRYQNQGFELDVPWTGPEATVAAFHRLHEQRYTFAQEDTPVEIVTLRVDARGVFPPPALEELPPAGALADALVARQIIHLEDGPADCPLYDRGKLGRGSVVEGPAILMQLDATTLILPGQTGTLDRVGNLIVAEA
ncbi:MAG TPA: hydantoinase/oxoprolinase family protein [Hyphomicrobiaceae bacterium]|nr:hydantoinase/oxoprolinase family protein [Hyphomicrobiaceae bacterium]